MSDQVYLTNHENGKREAQEKIFVDRPSLLTEMLEVKHFKTMRYICVAMLFGFLCNDTVAFFLNTEEVNFGFRMIQISFGKLHVTAMVWFTLFCASLLTHSFFKCWSWGRQHSVSRPFVRVCWDTFWLSISISYYFGSLYLAAIATVKFDLPMASSAIVLTEQVRLLMKCHAFVRSNAPKVLNHKPHSDTTLELPKFSTFLYFHFAPTLIYRDHYPRTKGVNWKYAAWCFKDVFLVVWLMSFIFEKYFANKLKHTGKEEINWKETVVVIFENCLLPLLMQFLMFFLLLHSWLNGFAEILRFADRRFYEDWWTSTNISFYLRTLNIVVQDWLFAYVYKDINELTKSKNKLFPKLVVLLLSAVIHEYILCFVLKFFLPVLFFQFFVLGTVLSNINTKHPIFNALVLYTFGLGNSINMNLYTMEYYARSNCPFDGYNVSSYLQPRILALSNCN